MQLTFLNKALKVLTMAGQLKPKRAKLCSKSDNYYFDAYADINVHEEMLEDETRTNAYKNAIFSLKNLIQNKVVLDVGAGTGILSCFCAQAGAKKVYAVEASGIAEQAKKVVLSNGLQNQIEIIKGLMEDIELPEKVDVIVSEWMGYCLLYESMLSSVITARDRWLKPGGIILPCTASLYMAPICDDEVVIEKVNFWNDMLDVYGIDMSCVLPFARQSLSKDVMVKPISCENILSRPQLIAQLDLAHVTQEEIENVCHSFSFNSFGIADFQGFAIWFDVRFPSYLPSKETVSSAAPQAEAQQNDRNNDTVHCEDQQQKEENVLQTCESEDPSVLKKPSSSVVLSTSPYSKETHWKQSILYLDNETSVKQDSKISGSISLSPSPNYRRFLSIKVSCRIDNGENIEKTYFMGYEVSSNSSENGS